MSSQCKSEDTDREDGGHHWTSTNDRNSLLICGYCDATKDIAELERRIADALLCDQHQFISYKPDLNGRIFFEVEDIQAALAPKDEGK